MKKVLLTLILSTFIISCSNDIENSNLNEINQKTFEQEIAFPNQNGEVSSFVMKNNKELYYTEIDTFKVFQGDILLSKGIIGFLAKEQKDSIINLESKSQKIKSAPAAISNRWTNSSVNFRISLSSRRDDILWAINHIRSNTNIEFAENASGNYIDFVESDGCSSYIGMTGGRQLIRLASGCGRGSIVHEICHALGVFHEQSRPDRNNHVIVNWGNIESGRSHNFDTELAHNYANFDFGSIMMYSPWAFSSNGSPTITRTDGSTYATQRIALSATDINALRDMYPGPNMIREKGGVYDNILDVGANINGDNVYIKKNRNSTAIYKNDILYRTYSWSYPISSIDITSNGEIITNLSGYNTRSLTGYTTVDISEGGGNIYCIAQKKRSTNTFNLYKKNGNNWTLISRVYGTRLTVDSNGRPWVLSKTNIRLYSDNGTFSNIDRPVYSNTWNEFIDIGSAGNEIYVSMGHARNSSVQLLKYSHIANQLIRQPGVANFLDGQGNGIVWSN